MGSDSPQSTLVTPFPKRRARSIRSLGFFPCFAINGLFPPVPPRQKPRKQCLTRCGSRRSPRKSRFPSPFMYFGLIVAADELANNLSPCERPEGAS